MEFAWSQSHLDYRKRVSGFLEKELPADWFETLQKGIATKEQAEFSRDFCPKLADAGLLTPQWPKEYGGEDGEAWEQFILAEEVWRWGEPRGPQYMGVNWIGPTLMRFGTEEQKDIHLKGIASGKLVWSQGFSEPQAGTDLGAMQTKAEWNGQGYTVNGMKLWTSYSEWADWIFLLARTGPERKQISVFLVDMKTPGIQVVPFPGLPEYGHLNEVYFDNVHIPASALLGEEHKGWDIMAFTLNFERVGLPRYIWGLRTLDIAVEQLKAEGRFDDPICRAAAGRIVARFEAATVLTYAVVDERINDIQGTVTPNVQRITAAQACLDLMSFMMDYVPDCLTGGNNFLELFYRGQVASTIAAGAYEIQLDAIAQRGLGMPRGR